MGTDRVFLTGASGFIGAHVLRALLDAGYSVRALARNPASDRHHIFAQLGDNSRADVEVVPGDLRRVGDAARSLNGCRYVVHCAALYSFAPRDRDALSSVNVGGTRSLFAAAHLAGVERAVLTSSSATIGPARNGFLADESSFADAEHATGYHGSKVAQERAAFASRLPVVAVLPTAPVGPGDWKPTPTGRLVRDFALGKIGAKAPGRGGLNMVAVEDVAAMHVAALRRGRTGERYVVGGENLTMDQVWHLLAQGSGQPMPRIRAPYWAALTVAAADELRCRLVRSAVPFAPMEGVRMSRLRMYADSSKARRELGYEPSPVEAAVRRAIGWHRQHAG